MGSKIWMAPRYNTNNANLDDFEEKKENNDGSLPFRPAVVFHVPWALFKQPLIMSLLPNVLPEQKQNFFYCTSLPCSASIWLPFDPRPLPQIKQKMKMVKYENASDGRVELRGWGARSAICHVPECLQVLLGQKFLCCEMQGRRILH